MASKTILITGCSTGIGLHAAQTLQQRGYQVFASARLHSQVKQLSSLGLKSVKIDLNNQESIEHGFKSVLNQTNGKLDYLFNNGAYGQPGAIEDLPTEVLRQQFETNLFGWHHLTRLAIKVMRQQGHGRIVQNSSVLGVVSMPYRGAYNASKYALEGLTDTLRLELAKTNIQVSLIEPGPIVSQFRANAAANFKINIDWRNSEHFNEYESQLSRLESEEVRTPFTLGPEAVTSKLIKALESKRAKARYRVTFPTYLFAILKRIVTTRALDRLLVKG